MSWPFLDLLHGHTICQEKAGAAMPLRYNYDKPEKPRITGTLAIVGILAAFVISIFDDDAFVMMSIPAGSHGKYCCPDRSLGGLCWRIFPAGSY